MNYNKVNQSISKNREQMHELQTQSASMKKLNRPSDDPVGMTKVMSSKSELQGANQYLKNLDVARQFITATDQALDELTQMLVRAKELALSQANDASASADTRKAVALEISQIYDHAVQVANRKQNDRFIFGGYMTTRQPFNDGGDYAGDKGEMMIEISKGTYIPMNVPGNMIFFGEDLARVQDPRTSKESPMNVKELAENVKEAREKYTPEQDIGEMHDDNVPIRGPASVRATMTSNKSLDGKQEISPNPIPEYGENIFKTLAHLETGLMANDKSIVQDSIDRLDKSIDQVVLGRAKVGSRANQLDSTMQTLYGTSFTEKANISQIEDADAFEIFSDLSKNDNALKATLASSAKILQPSLLDFLR